MSAEFFSRSLTGITYTPVCVGDLDASDYIVPANETTESVAKYLEVHPEVPGVLLTNGSEFIGIIPRAIMFERLGHRYGTELFLQKPIILLMRDLKTEMFTLPHHLRVDAAVQRALKRSVRTIYDPVVITFEDGRFRLLDMHMLLLVQSQMLENLNGVMNTLNRLDHVLKLDSPDKALKTILDSFRHVVPFHYAGLLLFGFENNPFLKFMQELVHFPGKLLEKNPVYKSIFDYQQTICMEDVQVSPGWQGVNGSGIARSWMGVPLVDQEGFLGILSISRYVVSPFTNNERDMAAAFAWYFSQVISEIIRPHITDEFPLQHIKVKRERFEQNALREIQKRTKLTL